MDDKGRRKKSSRGTGTGTRSRIDARRRCSTMTDKKEISSLALASLLNKIAEGKAADAIIEAYRMGYKNGRRSKDPEPQKPADE